MDRFPGSCEDNVGPSFVRTSDDVFPGHREYSYCGEVFCICSCSLFINFTFFSARYGRPLRCAREGVLFRDRVGNVDKVWGVFEKGADKQVTELFSLLLQAHRDGSLTGLKDVVLRSIPAH